MRPGAKTEGMCVMIDYCRSDPIPRQARKEATVGRSVGRSVGAAGTGAPSCSCARDFQLNV